MGKINVLDFEIANLIAAGEVVERPSSVLKELIENSIDAHATKIVAEIKRGGVSLIRVSDNGFGMTAEDLPVAIKRHATSKISSREDLESITTLGFRGEALAAISSVSKVTIITKTAEADVGTMLTSEGGKILDISEVGSSDGTTVVVEDLFYNVPARRKFLKKDATEAMNVAALVEKVALSRPDIAIQLLIDGNEKFSTSGDGDLYNTIYAVFGKDFATRLIKVEGVANGVRVSGYVGRSDNIRKNRNYENIFINGRYVKSLTAQAAVEKAFTSYIAPEGFPVCVLFLEMNPSMVDVNVHPAKLEVKFAGEQPVFEAIYHTVRSAIEEHEYRPELTLGAKPRNEKNHLGAFLPIGADTKGEQISIGSSYMSRTENTEKDRAVTGTNSYFDKPLSVASVALASHTEQQKNLDGYKYIGASRTYPGTSHTTTYTRQQAQETLTPRESVEILSKYASAESDKSYVPAISADNKTDVIATIKSPENYAADVQFKIIGEAFNCYVFVEYDGALLVIDKHAAHERIIFEELRKNREADGRIASQKLLLPISVLLSPVERSAAEEYKDELCSVGFGLDIGEGYINITAIPEATSAIDAETLFVKMIDELAEGRGNPALTDAERRERALYQVACKGAIKGGRVYDGAILEWLVGKVISLPDLTVCPHGRPVAFRLTKSELDRRFDRLK